MKPTENLEYWHQRKAIHSQKGGCKGCLREALKEIARFSLWARFCYFLRNLIP